MNSNIGANIVRYINMWLSLRIELVQVGFFHGWFFIIPSGVHFLVVMFGAMFGMSLTFIIKLLIISYGDPMLRYRFTMVVHR